jgi:hypothetical protein
MLSAARSTGAGTDDGTTPQTMPVDDAANDGRKMTTNDDI